MTRSEFSKISNEDELRRKLEGLEKKYGGLVQGVVRSVKSPHENKNYHSVHQGGDRMSSKYHNYSIDYSRFLLNFVLQSRPIKLLEIGILTGSGLAMWCDLFVPGSSVYGFDIDLSICQNNYSNLKSLGAFSYNAPVLKKFDQFEDNTDYVCDILSGSSLDIVIDDGCHTSTAILKTIQSIKPHLSDNFVYFIEDNTQVHKQIKQLYPQWNVFYNTQLTVIVPKSS